MKVLLFTDEHDIDGMGSIILCQKAFKQCDYITCKRFEVESNFKHAMAQGIFANYDLIMMTDICLREPLLSAVNGDKNLASKLVILDHHKTELAANQYAFCKVEIESDRGLASGTSLCYDYLVANNHLVANKALSELVELTRKYDTWEWKTKYHDSKPRMIHILFEELGYERYLKLMQKLVTNPNGLVLGDRENKLIKRFEERLETTLKQLIQHINVKDLTIGDDSFKIGLVETPYAYRNDLPDYLRDHRFTGIDLLAMIITDGDTVSYRNITDVDVSKVALYFGGKGHYAAGGSPKDNPLFISFAKDTPLIRKNR